MIFSHSFAFGFRWVTDFHQQVSFFCVKSIASFKYLRFFGAPQCVWAGGAAAARGRGCAARKGLGAWGQGRWALCLPARNSATWASRSVLRKESWRRRQQHSLGGEEAFKGEKLFEKW